jgi:hypothetical protein
MTKRYTGGVVSSSLPTVNAAGASGVFLLSQQADYQAKNNWPPFKVEKSLRFRAANSAYLSRTPAVAGNQQKWTWSAWIKKGYTSGDNVLFGCGTGGTGDTTWTYLTLADNFILNGYNQGWRVTSQVFRDPAAWYHLICAVDTTQSTANNRVKMYVNGVEITSFSTLNNPSQNSNLSINRAAQHTISSRQTYSNDGYFDGQMTEINFVDGQQLTPSSFGATDKDGNWSPIAYTGTYGQNGFYLNFKDATSTTTLGYDYSGNGNHWTSSGISVTAGATYDSMIDVPEDQSDGTANNRGNYCTLNPLHNAGTLSNANLNWSGSNQSTHGTIAANAGKYYFEVKLDTYSSGNAYIGISDDTWKGVDGNWGWDQVMGYVTDGRAGANGAAAAYGATYTQGDTIGVAFDITGNTITFYKNGTSQGVAFSTGLLGKNWRPWVYISASSAFTANFGQRPFTYTPPSGFKALNTYNLPEPAIKQPNKHFDINLWTGNGGTQVITNSGSMQPGMIWIKTRSAANYHCLQDIIRGTDGTLFPNATAAEETNQPRLSSFNSNGFTLTSKNDANGSGDTFVGWQWNAGTANVTNTSGSVTSIVRNNPTAGFSVVTFNAGSAGTQTVGHGLGVTPAMIIIKSRISTGAHWDVWHKSFANPAQGYMYLNLTNALANDARNYSNTAPTSSLFTFESGYEFNANQNYVAYFWAEIEGYSKFGSYVGNGSTDGPFVYTGFRPKFIMRKISSQAGYGWYMDDTSRNSYNVIKDFIRADVATAETINDTNYAVDILSNGFKVRSSHITQNNSGDTYIYMAFAESPFKYSRSR